MRGVVLVDTGPLYALRDPSDEHHNQANAQTRLLARTHLKSAVLFPTMLEAHRLVLSRLGRAEGRSFLADLERSAVFVNPDPDDYHRAIQTLRLFHDQKVTLADALLTEVSLRLGVPVWTFDRHFDVLRAPVWRL